MDESVQVLQNIRVQIIDDIDGKHSCSFLYILHMRKVFPLQRPEQMYSLLVIIILKDTLKRFLNLHFLLLSYLIYDLLHPWEVGIDVASFLAFHILSAVQEVIFLL